MESRVCVLLLLPLLFATLCTAEVPVDCCLSVLDKRLPAKVIESYTVQEEGHGCAIRATVVKVNGGRQLCLPPPEVAWMQRLIRIVDQKKNRPSV